jgi:hypothetical protein
MAALRAAMQRAGPAARNAARRHPPMSGKGPAVVHAPCPVLSDLPSGKMIGEFVCPYPEARLPPARPRWPVASLDRPRRPCPGAAGHSYGSLALHLP